MDGLPENVPVKVETVPVNAETVPVKAETINDNCENKLPLIVFVKSEHPDCVLTKSKTSVVQDDSSQQPLVKQEKSELPETDRVKTEPEDDNCKKNMAPKNIDDKCQKSNEDHIGNLSDSLLVERYISLAQDDGSSLKHKDADMSIGSIDSMDDMVNGDIAPKSPLYGKRRRVQPGTKSSLSPRGSQTGRQKTISSVASSSTLSPPRSAPTRSRIRSLGQSVSHVVPQTTDEALNQKSPRTRGSQRIGDVVGRGRGGGSGRRGGSSKRRGGSSVRRGGPSVRRGGPSESRGGPSESRGGPSERRGGPSERRGGPSERRGGPSERRGGPSEHRGGPSERRGGPSERRGGPSERRGGPSERRGGPSERRGGPSERRGGPSESRGGPSERRGGPSERRGGPSERRGGPRESRGGGSGCRGRPSARRGGRSGRRGGRGQHQLPELPNIKESDVAAVLTASSSVAMDVAAADSGTLVKSEPEVHPSCSTAMFEKGRSVPSTSSCSQIQPVSSGQVPCDKEMVFELNYGSEPDSDESDEEESVSSFIPRVFRGILDTEMTDEEIFDATTPSPLPAAEEIPPTATDQPWSLYDFQWTEFPKPPIPPRTRRETFTQTIVGPTIPLVDPYDVFVAIWDRPIMEHIASETNRYAQQVTDQMLRNDSLHPRSRICRWSDTTADEMYVYLAILMAMGSVVKSQLAEYWSTAQDIFCTPGFSTYMSINRFTLLSKCLHFNNNEDMCALKLDGSEAKLFKIYPILSYLNNKFQSLYIPKQNISIDESLLQWKGFLHINQSTTTKAARMGIKTYEICESQTGYLWRFEVHSHKKPSLQKSGDPIKTLKPEIVLRLLHGLENKGYTVWMDNCYSSPYVARCLKALGFDCVGTLRTNRKFVPQALRSLTKENMQPGQIIGLTSGDVDVMVWSDKHRVAMISTYHGDATAQHRGVTKPVAVIDYNIMMGGVDKKDQMLAMYPIEGRRIRVWYKNLFQRLINVSILNSYVIHRCSGHLSQSEFRKSLIRSLLSKHHIAPTNASFSLLGTPMKVDITHRLATTPLVNSKHLRRACKVCKKRTHIFCVGCKVPVCMEPCFLALHT